MHTGCMIYLRDNLDSCDSICNYIFLSHQLKATNSREREREREREVMIACKNIFHAQALSCRGVGRGHWAVAPLGAENAL